MHIISNGTAFPIAGLARASASLSRGGSCHPGSVVAGAVDNSLVGRVHSVFFFKRQVESETCLSSPEDAGANEAYQVFKHDS